MVFLNVVITAGRLEIQCRCFETENRNDDFWGKGNRQELFRGSISRRQFPVLVRLQPVKDWEGSRNTLSCPRKFHCAPECVISKKKRRNIYDCSDSRSLEASLSYTKDTDLSSKYFFVYIELGEFFLQNLDCL